MKESALHKEKPGVGVVAGIEILKWRMEKRRMRRDGAAGGMEKARAKALWFECCVPREMRTG